MWQIYLTHDCRRSAKKKFLHLLPVYETWLEAYHKVRQRKVFLVFVLLALERDFLARQWIIFGGFKAVSHKFFDIIRYKSHFQLFFLNFPHLFTSSLPTEQKSLFCASFIEKLFFLQLLWHLLLLLFIWPEKATRMRCWEEQELFPQHVAMGWKITKHTD